MDEQRRISCASAFGTLARSLFLVVALSSEVGAQAPDASSSPEGSGVEAPAQHEKERRNGVELGFTHAFQLLRTSTSEAEAGRSENLLGFVIGYERTLIPHRLTLVVAKPFHFTRDRFDSPLDIYLKVNFPKGRWDPYIAPGISGNLRVFGGELEQEEGRRLEYTFGVGAITGFIYSFTPRWGISVEVGYLYFVNGIAQHSIIDSVAGVFFF